MINQTLVEARRMTARFDGRCANCWGRIAAGDTMLWSRPERKAWHESCDTVINPRPDDVEERPRSLLAKYAGTCKHCFGHFDAGDPIQYLRPNAFHLACEPTLGEDPADTGLDLSVLPYGTYRFAACDDEGTLQFVRIDLIPETDEDGEPKRWGGNIYVKHARGGRLGRQVKGQHYTGQMADVLENVLRDPEGCAARYGHEIGECSICSKTLVTEESRSYGIGPVCRKRFTWNKGRVQHQTDADAEEDAA